MLNKVTKHKMKFLLLTIICFLFFTGCSSNIYVLRGIKVELTEKTMTVPAAGGRTLFFIKKELIKAGWKLKIADSSLEEEKISSKTMVKEVKFDTAFRLYFSKDPDPKNPYAYTITIVENKSNAVVLEINSESEGGITIGRAIVKELENQNVKEKEKEKETQDVKIWDKKKKKNDAKFWQYDFWFDE